MERVEDCDDLYVVDTRFLGHERHAASFVLDAETTAIIETGASTGVGRVLEGLDELGIGRGEVELIVPTHVHLDHAGGAGYLADECENATVVCHENGVDYLSDPEKVERLVESVRSTVGGMADGYGDVKPIPRHRFRAVSGGETLSLGDHELEVVNAPGHAPHQFCLYDDASGCLFTADEAGVYLGGSLYPTTPPPNFDLDANLESLERLASYEPETLVYTHYGPRSDAVEALDEYGRLLTDWVRDVEEAWNEYGDEEAVVDEFMGEDYHEDWGDASSRETLRMDVHGVLGYLRG